MTSIALGLVGGVGGLSMAGLHETINPERYGRIDTIGWLFVAFVVVITAIAAMIAYNASDITVTNTVSHVAGPTG